MKIAVIGAGIVGISSANWLQKYGQDVTLFDMNDPCLLYTSDAADD